MINYNNIIIINTKISLKIRCFVSRGISNKNHINWSIRSFLALRIKKCFILSQVQPRKNDKILTICRIIFADFFYIRNQSSIFS